MIKVGVGDYDHGKFFGIEFVKEGQCFFSAFIDHESAVEHDLLVVDGEDEAGAADFAACSKW